MKLNVSYETSKMDTMVDYNERKKLPSRIPRLMRNGSNKSSKTENDNYLSLSSLDTKIPIIGTNPAVYSITDSILAEIKKENNLKQTNKSSIEDLKMIHKAESLETFKLDLKFINSPSEPKLETIKEQETNDFVPFSIKSAFNSSSIENILNEMEGFQTPKSVLSERKHFNMKNIDLYDITPIPSPQPIAKNEKQFHTSVTRIHQSNINIFQATTETYSREIRASSFAKPIGKFTFEPEPEQMESKIEVEPKQSVESSTKLPQLNSQSPKPKNRKMSKFSLKKKKMKHNNEPLNCNVDVIYENVKIVKPWYKRNPIKPIQRMFSNVLPNK